MDMLGKVRRMKMRDKLSISQIAKQTGLARNTIRGWLRAPGDVVPKYERRLDVHKLSAFEESLAMALKADRLHHKDSRRAVRGSVQFDDEERSHYDHRNDIVIHS